jgi:ABC-2 type transport system permease protein
VVVMFPLVFLSNAFVPAETMPSGLRYFVLRINPLSRVVTVVRQLLEIVPPTVEVGGGSVINL